MLHVNQIKLRPIRGSVMSGPFIGCFSNNLQRQRDPQPAVAGCFHWAVALNVCMLVVGAAAGRV